jgi:hypothetical protein
MRYDAYSMDDIEIQKTDFIKVIQNGYVKDVEYCLSCGSVNILTSKKGNKYCGEICWREDIITN